MSQETFRVSQKELQRVAVIASCVKGDLACARAAELLDLTPRQIKRLKARYRRGSAAALAHASRGRPSHRRIPQRVRDRIVQLARTRYDGFNDHHLCEKLIVRRAVELHQLAFASDAQTTLAMSGRATFAWRAQSLAAQQATEGFAAEREAFLLDWLQGRGPRL